MRPATASPLDQERPFGADELFFSTTDRKGVILNGNDVFVRVSGHPLFVVDRLPYFQIKQCAGIRDPREAETTTNWKE